MEVTDDGVFEVYGRRGRQDTSRLFRLSDAAEHPRQAHRRPQRPPVIQGWL